MASTQRQNAPPTAPRRAAVYLRVSTGRQAENDVSLPSQRDLTNRFCTAQGWTVVEEYVEPGAPATDDRRPVFQRMLEDARSPERRFDVICVHAFSLFYRTCAACGSSSPSRRRCDRSGRRRGRRSHRTAGPGFWRPRACVGTPADDRRSPTRRVPHTPRQRSILESRRTGSSGRAATAGIRRSPPADRC